MMSETMADLKTSKIMPGHFVVTGEYPDTAKVQNQYSPKWTKERSIK